MTMTPQQKAPSKDLGSWIQEGGKKMKASVQRRRSSSAIGRALSKNKAHSRQITFIPSHCGSGLLLGSFCSHNNMFLLKERVQLSSGWHTQERHLFLFSDSLIIAKSKSASSMKLKKQVRLNEVWISSSLRDVSERRHSIDDSFVIGWPITNYVVTFSSSDTKEKWLSTLNWHISEVKKDEISGKIAISVLYLDADEYMSSTTVTVSNMDTAEKVIKVVSQQLEIPGRHSDYHLWVTSGKDEPPYPLFGHEYPYSIAMNCLQESVVMARGLNNNLASEHSADSILEHFTNERHCQFIIKLRPQGPMDVRKESAQKQCRRKKSLIDWALRRSGSATLSTPSSQSPITPRKLFGHSLPSVCPNGNLPKPIMDMLLLLYEEGANTRGIFRRSANAKTCKELKEKLLSGDDVQMDGKSVFVAAAVIMDFLRNIPDSILSSDMYGLWMEVTEIEQPENRIKVIKSLLDQLPEANFNLLQHLFAILNHIGKNSEENQMTPLNLALCIAPTMLWLPTGADPEEESKSTKKVAHLVQFLIENYLLIFEQDASFLFSKHRQQESGSTNDLTDMHMIHQQDSSDELEFAASDLDKSEPNLLKDEDGLFESLLLEEREDWDLFSEISACYLNKTKIDILNCMDSSCCLSPARDRCSSEPSVCHSSRLSAQNHEPVARQSSCDATIIHSHLDCINRMKQLQLESQNLLNEDLAPSMKHKKYGLWKSPQTETLKENDSQMTIPSKRSSFSSLSSTTTSPSVSSLSSLDSAFSYCSESPVFHPSEVSSLPFMFGTSARLHTLSPEITRKKLREWHIPLSTLFGVSSCDLDSWEMQWEPNGQNNIKETDKANDVVPVQGSIHNESLDKESSQSFFSSGKDRFTFLQKPKCKVSHVKTDSISENGNCVHKEISVKQIEIKKAESSREERPQQTKMSFYASPNVMSITNLNDQNLNEISCSAGCQVTKLQIPQTLFYGQNTPLVLHSVSRKQHPEVEKPQWETQLTHVVRRSSADEMVIYNGDLSSAFINKDVLHKGHEEPQSTKETQLAKSHTKNITTFSQTIRIILPSSVKNTVREYFKHSNPKSPTSHDVTVTNDVFQEKTENLQGTEDHPGA